MLCISTHLQIVTDAIMKVSVDVLKRVYEALQDQGERTQIEKELIDPEKHLFFIDAFDMPRWTWSSERGTFEKFVEFIRITMLF
jgi:DNA polymerase epsilon subunit 2